MHDSLSRLVAGGGPAAPQVMSSVYQPYGERPSSGRHLANGVAVLSPVGGFDANVAGQWNANVQRGVQNSQSRYDPSVAGPRLPSGGQRITQAPGGVSSLDLSEPYGNSVPSHPPRLPGRVGASGAGYVQQAQGGSYQDLRQPSPSSIARRGAPFGVQDDVSLGRPPPPRQAPPFGVDVGAAGANSSSRSNSRGRNPIVESSFVSPSSNVPPPRGRNPIMDGNYGGHAIDAGVARGGGRAGRTPGGSSQIVFG